MQHVYLKVYYRPRTEYVVAFSIGATDKKFKIKSTKAGMVVDNIFVPVKSQIVFDSKFTGVITPGSEECRFCSGNPDNFHKMYHIMSVPDYQATRYLETLKKQLIKSELFLR